MGANEESVGELVSRVADAFGEQAGLHVELAKAELARDARALSSAAAPLALGIPLLSLGYLFTNGAGALALGNWIGFAGGFGVVGLLNLVVGGIVVRRSATQVANVR